MVDRTSRPRASPRWTLVWTERGIVGLWVSSRRILSFPGGDYQLDWASS